MCACEWDFTCSRCAEQEDDEFERDGSYSRPPVGSVDVED